MKASPPEAGQAFVTGVSNSELFLVISPFCICGQMTESENVYVDSDILLN